MRPFPFPPKMGSHYWTSELKNASIEDRGIFFFFLLLIFSELWNCDFEGVRHNFDFDMVGEADVVAVAVEGRFL